VAACRRALAGWRSLNLATATVISHPWLRSPDHQCNSSGFPVVLRCTANHLDRIRHVDSLIGWP
jgi:hypothetical protein